MTCSVEIEVVPVHAWQGDTFRVDTHQTRPVGRMVMIVMTFVTHMYLVFVFNLVYSGITLPTSEWREGREGG